jgi:hypothetical protein
MRKIAATLSTLAMFSLTTLPLQAAPLPTTVEIAQGGTVCDVVNLQRGQLALRFTPNGESRAGLNNGNTVELMRQQGIWAYVRVLDGPNASVDGLQGWVNANYLSCYDTSSEPIPIFCDVVNIQRGQLALRFSPNGESKAGLNNGNVVRWLDNQGIWAYVRVLEGPNSRVEGMEGWVNSNYLSCYD